MRIFKREMWSYVVLLLILFALASVSVSQVLLHLHDLLIDPEREFPPVAALILLLTMGFMLLAGAFGLWTIQFVTEKEAQRRLTQLVDAMDHLQDGMIVVDKAGRVTAMNSGAKKLVLAGNDTGSFVTMFPGLSATAVERLLNCEETTEMEESIEEESRPARTLRFRCQPVDSFHVIMLSDVTALNLQRQHTLVKARLQLLGELAKGMAHDFSTLLVDISGYTAILSRVPRSAPEYDQAIRSIVHCTERGTSLAEQILSLARRTTAGSTTDLAVEHARAASEDLASVLPPEWQVAFTSDGRLPMVALSGLQIEQIVINLSLLVAENRRHPGTVSISVSAIQPAGRGHYAGALTIRAGTSQPEPVAQASAAGGSTPSGVILSVVKSIVEDAGGRIEATVLADGTPLFKVLLPRGAASTTLLASSLPSEQTLEMAGWRILLACGGKPAIEERLSQMGVSVTNVNDVVSVLAMLEKEQELDGMIVDHHLLKPETHGLLRAIRKLRPDCGIVVLSEEEAEGTELPEGVIFASRQLPADSILSGLFQAHRKASGSPSAKKG